MTVWAVTTTEPDERGGDIYITERVFTTRELAEEVARHDGGDVDEWRIVTELPEPQRWVYRQVEMYPDGTPRGPEQHTRSSAYYARNDRGWRGLYVNGEQLRQFAGWMTLQMNVPDLAEHHEWFETLRSLVQADPARFIAKGSDYEYFEYPPGM